MPAPPVQSSSYAAEERSHFFGRFDDVAGLPGACDSAAWAGGGGDAGGSSAHRGGGFGAQRFSIVADGAAGPDAGYGLHDRVRDAERSAGGGAARAWNS